MSEWRSLSQPERDAVRIAMTRPGMGAEYQRETAIYALRHVGADPELLDGLDLDALLGLLNSLLREAD